MVRAPSLHDRVAVQDRDAVACADVVDDLDETFVARCVRTFFSELRANQQQRHASGAGRLDPAFHGGAKQRLVDAHERVVGADLPDYELRPSSFERSLKPQQRFGGKLPADPGIPDDGRDAVFMRKLVFQASRIGVRGRGRPDPLGGGRSNREDFEPTVRAAV